MGGAADRGRGRLSVLLLCDDSPSHAPNVLEHIRALEQMSRHRVEAFNPIGIGRSRLLRIDDYDVVVIHYSVFVLEERHLSQWFREQVGAFGGLKVQFIQDEYRRVDEVTARMRELGVDVVFSSVPPRAVPDVYGSRLRGVDILPTLTGYVPAAVEKQPLQTPTGRPVDVVYRGRSIPYWLGRLGQDKVTIGREFLARAAATDLRCDISWTEADRIYGDEWYRFLASARATLGTESGASIVDFDGSLQERTNRYLRAHPAASFEEVESEILAPYEGNAVIDAISPRVFEAAALGTAMVNFAGRYSDVIEPWVHYIPLEKDFSNFDDVAGLLRDDAELERLTSRAHADLVASGRYSLRTFVEGFDREIESRAGASGGRRPAAGGGLRRALLQVEQLGSPSRLAQVPFVASARGRAAARALERLIQRFPEIEALALAEQEPGRRARLLHDLERLAAATAAHVRELRYIGRPFDMRLELDDGDRRLTLVGTKEPAQSEPELQELEARVTSAIRTQRLEEIVWNNSAIGSLIFLTIPPSSLDIGYHVTGSTHRFTALLELAQRDPENVISALAPLFRSRPDEPVHELDRRTALLAEAMRRPGPTAARGMASARSTLRSKELRRLLRAYLRSAEARAEAPLQVVLKDFFRLDLVRQYRTTMELDADGRRLVYRTTAGTSGNGAVALDPAAIRALEEIVWDHSAAGSSVTSRTRPRVSVPLGDDGVHDFQALTLVARRFPELAAPALRQAATDG